MMTSSSQSYQNKGKALLRAAKKGQLNDVRKNLAGGAPVEYADFKASANDHGQVVQVLLECGAAIDYTCNGKTALHAAASMNRLSAICMLIKYGANVDCTKPKNDLSVIQTRQDGQTPLYNVVNSWNSNVMAVEYLLQAGATTGIATKVTNPCLIRKTLDTRTSKQFTYVPQN
ncbi:Aste57867_4316 [Aphanomyces stellatus]|uniref:Aste57867_4316 protein n=1 Tax=Aphanomyces stellatus TaxID=120398 RepID=A0A485KF81_9STRA|nr:hypothetical protein As57867_004305 [Aphanomyces stellatus]VFT81430.1 Aste57867_4316 [Aphanomyces stellatus]